MENFILFQKYIKALNRKLNIIYELLIIPNHDSSWSFKAKTIIKIGTLERPIAEFKRLKYRWATSERKKHPVALDFYHHTYPSFTELF